MNRFYFSALAFVALTFCASSHASFSRFDDPEKAITESENVLRIRVIKSVSLRDLDEGYGKSAEIRLITFRILNTYKEHPDSILGFSSKVGMATHFHGVGGFFNTRFQPQREYVICFDGDGVTPTIRMSTAVFEIREGKVLRLSNQGVFKDSYADFVAWMKPLIVSASSGESSAKSESANETSR